MNLLYGDLHDQMREYITATYGDTTWEAFLIVYKYFPNFSTSDDFRVSANGVLHSTKPNAAWTDVFVNGKTILSIGRVKSKTYYVPMNINRYRSFEFEINMFEEFLREIALTEIIEK